MFRRRRREVPEASESLETPEWSSLFGAFLDQARWGLDVQHQRSATFVTGASTVLGFDGVVLALTVGTGGVGTLDGVSTWLARACLVMVVLSAIATLGALLPRNVASVDWARVTKAWAEVHDPSVDTREDPRQLFPQLILAVGELPTSRPRRSILSWRTRSDRPLEAASELAASRGRWFAASVIMLVAALVLLLSAQLVSGGSAPATGQPTASPAVMTPQR